MNAIRLSLLSDQLKGVAEVMGTALARSAFSPNIRVRLDFSCALFDSRGDLLAQAAHIPVHLGSMPDQIKRLVKSFTLRSGELYIGNDPYDGGTHLPDITLMEPIFCEGGELLGVAAARAHHADVGGATPGSMASQNNIYADGLRIPLTRIARDDQWDQGVLSLLLTNMRNPADREGDLFAQRAACRQGVLGLRRVFRTWARGQTSHWRSGVAALFEAAREGTIRVLKQLLGDDQNGRFQDLLEVGNESVPICVTLSLREHRTLVADFQGTSAAVAAGFNATLPVTKAAVCYVLRCLATDPLPLNQGFLDCVEVIAEPGSLVAARYPSAVAAGNVETSQRIVDVVFGAFSELAPEKVPAASAGSMNNVSFGFTDPRFGVHYETSGGGAGGCPGGAKKACSGVQVHMTNTLSTPTEVLEEEFPVRIECHTTRTDSGGSGKHEGGEGTTKIFTFLKEATLTVMATRRTTRPYGLQGGEEGRPGEQRVRKNGEWSPVGASSTHLLKEGDSFRLDTPGGGGWGTR